MTNSLLVIPFRREVVDPKPPSGPDCCTDVLAVGDIDGDGKPDFVLGSQGSSGAGLAWYENPTWLRHEVASGEFTTDGKIADIDSDGDQDIVIGDMTRGLTWYQNLGKGSSWKPQVVDQDYVHDIEIGDLDGDTKPEIVTCDKRQVRVWKQDPHWFGTTVRTANGEGLALADIDNDRDWDIVLGAHWLQNNGLAQKWPVHTISSRWPTDTRVRVADMNDDGHLDVVLTASEGRGDVSWFEYLNTPDAEWREHKISQGVIEGAHSLIVADLDSDNDLDVTVAEMHTSEKKRILNFVNEKNDHWLSQTLAATGSHNMQAADIDGDGDVDLVGKNYAGSARALELWRNLSRENFGSMSSSTAPYIAKGWQYVAIDDRRDDDQQGKMGLVSSDVNGDGRRDVIAGSILYLNPGDDLAQPWKRVRVGKDVDIFFSIRRDANGVEQLVGTRGSSLLLFRATDRTASSWTEKEVGSVPNARTQGYVPAELETRGTPQLVLTRGNSLFYLRIHDNLDGVPWPQVNVSTDVEEGGVASADMDRDGHLDLISIGTGGREVFWFRNPGTGAAGWEKHRIGGIKADGRWLDRVLSADINADARADVVVSEETQDWTYNASVYWFESPKDPREGNWQQHDICTLRSANSLDIHDMNKDGAPDVIVAEHTDMRGSQGAPNNLTVIYVNANHGASWHAKPIESGPHSSHLGARVFDLDSDGRAEIVSLGWNQYRRLHLWWQISN